MIYLDRKQATLERLLHELIRTSEEYHTCIKNDEVFSVKKKIRLRLKEIQEQIKLLTEMTKEKTCTPASYLSQHKK